MKKNNFVVLSYGTDGIDGFTDAAGAFLDNSIINNIKRKKLDYITYLDNNDSYNFFKKAHGLIITGPTGTNVMDIFIGII